jgi:hypothetical protein
MRLIAPLRCRDRRLIHRPYRADSLGGLARDGEFDAEEQCREAFGLPLEEISKKAASQLIEQWKAINKTAARLP